MSRRDAVAQVYDTAGKAAFVQQLECGMDARGEGTLATTDQNWPEQEMALVNQPFGDRLAGELRSADRRVRIARSPSAV